MRRLEVPMGPVPLWSKDRKVGARMINARSATVTEKAVVPEGGRSRT
jgi:putative SOS response-associated peptidase YedK